MVNKNKSFLFLFFRLQNKFEILVYETIFKCSLHPNKFSFFVISQLLNTTLIEFCLYYFIKLGQKVIFNFK